MQLLTIFAKSSTLVVWQGSEYAFGRDYLSIWKIFHKLKWNCFSFGKPIASVKLCKTKHVHVLCNYSRVMSIFKMVWYSWEAWCHSLSIWSSKIKTCAKCHLTHFIITYHISLVNVQINYCNTNILNFDIK